MKTVGFDFDGVLSRTSIGKAIVAFVHPTRPAHRYIAERASPHPEGVQLLRDVQRAGYPVFIITGRPSTIRSETEAWLLEHGLAQMRNKLHMNRTRRIDLPTLISAKKHSIEQLGVDIFIEDNPKIASALAAIPGLQVILHRGDWAETVRDVWDAIEDIHSIQTIQSIQTTDFPENPDNRIVISVPHATGSREAHGYDFIALEMAKRIKKGLKVPNERFFEGDLPRDILDLNRDMTRWTTRFRYRLREAVKEAPLHTIHLDIHSFRIDSPVYGEYEMALATAEKTPQRYELEFRDYLREHGVNVEIVLYRVMDIVPEARELGVPLSFLIEFNEGLTKARRDELASLVVDFIYSKMAN